MREIALLALLLLPNWGYFSNVRAVAEKSIMPQKTVVAAEKALPSINPAPTKQTTDSYLDSAKAVYSVDLSSNATLASKATNDKLQIASLTKLMTAYVYLKDNPDLTGVVTVPAYTLQEGDAIVGLNPGEQLTKKDLLTGMLMNSGSDAAQSLAILDSGSIAKFVLKMNSAAETLGLSNTHYQNPVGWDDPGNYSSATDTLNLTRVLLANDFFKDTVATKTKAIYTTAGRTIDLASTNELLGTDDYIGVKTGFTNGALQCLVSLQQVSSHEILTVVLGSTDRFGETSALNTWTNSHFLW